MNRPALAKLKPKDKIRLWNIAVGDTVRVISGPSKGTIGKVQECLKDRNKIIVSGVNIVKKMLPAFLAKASGLETQKFEYAAPIHYSNVQLVGDLPDASNPTGPKRQVMIKRVHHGKLFYNKEKKLLTWRRWVPNENVFLPWPRNEKDKIKGTMDTKEADVKSNTYLESLPEPPIPIELQHELRNKYSKHRFLPTRVEANTAEIEDVEGIEADTKQISSPPNPLKGLSDDTISLLAQAMSKSSFQAVPPPSDK